jgi:hypothetical protein
MRIAIVWSWRNPTGDSIEMALEVKKTTAESLSLAVDGKGV